MKAITLSQPWAELVASGRKEWETRSWRTSYRGPVAIHAARRGSGLSAEEFGDWCRRFGLDERWMSFGAVVAVANLTDCKRVEEIRDELSADEYDAGDYGDGRYAWRLSEVTRLASPVAVRGQLGLWTLPEGVRWELQGAAI